MNFDKHFVHIFELFYLRINKNNKLTVYILCIHNNFIITFNLFNFNHLKFSIINFF